MLKGLTLISVFMVICVDAREIAVSFQFNNNVKEDASIEEVSLQTGSSWGEHLEENVPGNGGFTQGHREAVEMARAFLLLAILISVCACAWSANIRYRMYEKTYDDQRRASDIEKDLEAVSEEKQPAITADAVNAEDRDENLNTVAENSEEDLTPLAEERDDNSNALAAESLNPSAEDLNTFAKDPEETIAEDPEENLNTFAEDPEDNINTFAEEPEENMNTIAKDPEENMNTIAKEPEENLYPLAEEPEENSNVLAVNSVDD
eukprot:Em0006g812a